VDDLAAFLGMKKKWFSSLLKEIVSCLTRGKIRLENTRHFRQLYHFSMRRKRAKLSIVQQHNICFKQIVTFLQLNVNHVILLPFHFIVN